MSISVIHEYAILYSDRLVQKDKKWVDGSLKYYEFNNKFEVYNESGILVKTGFKNVVFEQDKQYTINGILIEIVDVGNVSSRDISGLFKKEGMVKSAQPASAKPSQTDQTDKGIKKSDIPLKEITSKYRTISDGILQPSVHALMTRTKSVGLKRPGGVPATGNRGLNGIKKPIKSNINSTKGEGKSQNTTETNVNRANAVNCTTSRAIVDPIIKRVPPQSTKIYRFIN